jgi:hypothetical protein
MVSNSEPPRFTVYRGYRRITSRQFEYGRNGGCSYTWRVPVTAFGDLRIVASARMGEAGWVQGTPVLYHWPWYWHLPTCGPWLLLAAGILLPARNRTRMAVLVLVPILIFNLLWGPVTKLAGVSSAATEEFRLLSEPLVIGAALLWRNADTLGRYHGIKRLGAAFGIMLLAGLVAIVSHGRTFSGERSIVLIFIAITAAVLLVSLALTRWRVHGCYTPRRFLLWLAAWSIPCSVLGTIVFHGIVRPSTILYPTLHILVETLAFGLVLGLWLYTIQLPYLLLMFTSPFFRRRFQVWLGVESLLPQAQAANPEGSCSGRNE